MINPKITYTPIKNTAFRFILRGIILYAEKAVNVTLNIQDLKQKYFFV